MSTTEQSMQASVDDVDDVKVKVEQSSDDNTLVTRDDLKEVNEPVRAKSLWSDSNRLEKLRSEMNMLSTVRIPVEQIPENIILKAMAEVLAELGWDNYDAFSRTINRILKGPPRSVPFAVKTRNQRSGKMDFLLIRVFINVGENNYEIEVENDGKMQTRKYKKRDVLMSHQFCDYLRDYCRTELHDEAQFWMFTGLHKNKQRLDMSKLNQDDMNALKALGEINANNLVMVQLKKKTPEVYVGGKTVEVGI